MKSRFVLALVASALATSGGVMLACGGGDDSGFSSGTDAGGDGTISSQGDGSADSASTFDGSMMGGGDAGGHCTPVTGACDIVLQDCPDKSGQKQECVVGQNAQGAPATVCVAPQASESLPIGRACCPDDNANPCLPGLECIGTACSDGGPLTGRCSPHCCMGDNSPCGMSDPEGIAGSCEVTVTIGGNDEYYVCTYKEFCTPLGVKPCKSANTTCDVQDKSGTAVCDPYFQAVLSGEHQPCGQGCDDGMGCFIKTFSDGGTATFPDGGVENECLVFCHTPGSATPFDGGLLNNAYGHGGCGDGGETCSATLDPNSFPAWMSVCVP